MPNQQTHHEHHGARSAPSWREPQIQSSSGPIETDETYGLVSVLYHALQGAETYAKYIEDASRAGEMELVEFFRECQQQENRRALRAKQLLAAQLQDVAGEEYEEEDDDADEEED